MFKRLPLVLILVAMFWQSVGLLSQDTVVRRGGDIAHLVTHAQDAAHHHHADHSVHVDKTGTDGVHQHAEGGPSAAVLFVVALNNFAIFPPVTPIMRDPLPHLPPHLEGLLRPPKTRA